MTSVPARISLAPDLSGGGEGELSIKLAQVERRGDLQHELVRAYKQFKY